MWVANFIPQSLYHRGIHWIWGWEGPRAGLDPVAKRKNPCPCQESNSGCPARSLVAMLLELPRLREINVLQLSDLLILKVETSTLLLVSRSQVYTTLHKQFQWDSWDSDSQEIPHLLWNPKVNYRIYYSLSMDPTLRQTYPVDTLKPISLNFNIVPTSSFQVSRLHFCNNSSSLPCVLQTPTTPPL
jgi:hypothetical protein